MQKECSSPIAGRRVTKCDPCLLLRLDLGTVESVQAELELNVVHVEIFDVRVTWNDIEDGTDGTFVFGAPHSADPTNLIFNVEGCHGMGK